jgi:hypothetical protein
LFQKAKSAASPTGGGDKFRPGISENPESLLFCGDSLWIGSEETGGFRSSKEAAREEGIPNKGAKKVDVISGLLLRLPQL